MVQAFYDSIMFSVNPNAMSSFLKIARDTELTHS